MTETKQELLQKLRAELLKQGFDASPLSDEALEELCKQADIEILPPPILN